MASSKKSSKTPKPDSKTTTPPTTPKPGTPPAPAPGPTTAGPFDFNGRTGSQTNLNQEVFNALQAQSQAEGRRITLQEWQSAGGSPYDYHKLYGAVDNAQMANVLNVAQAEGRRATINEYMAAGGNPNEYFKLYGENNFDQVLMADASARAKAEGRRLTLQEWVAAGGNPWQYESATAKDPYAEGIAKAGTKSDSTKLGDVREINAAKVKLPGDTQMKSAQIDPVAMATETQLGAPAQMGNTNLAPATLADRTAIGNAAQAGDVSVGDAAQLGVTDSAAYNKQLQLAQALEAQANGQGPSLATLQIQQAMERGLKNEMGALSAQPGVSQALAARLYGQQAGQARNEAAMAGAQARMAEQIAARQQLNELLNASRGADISVGQGNQAAQNQALLAQAQIQTQLETANATARNELIKAQATLDQANAQFNAGAINEQQLNQAKIAFDTAATNAQLRNQAVLQQGELNNKTSLANQLATNTRAYNQAQLTQSANQSNADIAYKSAIEQAKLNQEASQANQSAFNARNIAQGNISGGMAQASTQAGATVGAAGLAANAVIESAQIDQETAITTNAQDNAAHDSVIEAPTEKPKPPPATTTPTSSGGSGGSSPTVGGGRTGSLVSDKKAKKNIKPGDTDARAMMDQLAAAIFEYKNKSNGTGKQVGVMAQDLEKSKLGGQIVDNKKGQKQVDFAKGLGAVLAAQADLNKRLKALEGRR